MLTKTVVGKPEGRRPVGKHRSRQEDNIKMDITRVGYKSADWIRVAQD
jgi:hypothetical protein